MGIVGNLIGQRQQYNAQKNAINNSNATQERIANQNLALQEKLTNQQREDFKPWLAAGENALNQLLQGVQNGDFVNGEFKPSKFNFNDYKDAGYNFRLSEGLKALDRGAAARGLLHSGGQQKAINNYAQDMASQEYQNAYSRYGQQYNRDLNTYNTNQNRKNYQYNILSGLSSMGQNAAARQAGATSQLANTSANILSNLGNYQANNALRLGDAAANQYQGYRNILNDGITQGVYLGSRFGLF